MVTDGRMVVVIPGGVGIISRTATGPRSMTMEWGEGGDTERRPGGC